MSVGIWAERAGTTLRVKRNGAAAGGAARRGGHGLASEVQCDQETEKEVWTTHRVNRNGRGVGECAQDEGHVL